VTVARDNAASAICAISAARWPAPVSDSARESRRDGHRQCRVEWSLDRVARGHRQIGFAEQYFTDCRSVAQVNVYVVQAHARKDTEIT
jgi:hypothetical protein